MRNAECGMRHEFAYKAQTENFSTKIQTCTLSSPITSPFLLFAELNTPCNHNTPQHTT